MMGGALAAGRKLGIKVVADLHENWVAALAQYAWSNKLPGRIFVDLKRWDVLETRWTSLSDAVIVVIEEMAERLGRKGVPMPLMRVVPNTVHRSSFDALRGASELPSSKPERFTILYTGGMDRHRGIETAIKAMSSVRETIADAQLVLVGDGAVREELEALVESLGLTGTVHFEGWQPQHLIPGYIDRAHVGLIPHLRNEHTDHTIPHKLFHYMYGRLPVVASNCKPLERIVSETLSGTVYESGDHEALADVLLRLASDEHLLRRAGENGRKAVDHKFNWETTSKALIELYSELLNDQSVPAID